MHDFKLGQKLILVEFERKPRRVHEVAIEAIGLEFLTCECDAFPGGSVDVDAETLRLKGARLDRCYRSMREYEDDSKAKGLWESFRIKVASQGKPKHLGVNEMLYLQTIVFGDEKQPVESRKAERGRA